ncbi:hypothetical protein CN138_31780 [Sinorhizobium meliloti]|uniref:hypothetical protein n=1 Tax=Rhizobium meliloti TaxID=382 RepID=UPI0001E4B9CC|nr:hypothetical protein [Sinorhizobium meliloti]AEG53594.1 hypothetical protein Sinme_1867 [Sinorhizobium meliloti AK83]MDE4590684.1 hypothetical protein [Sinorhizobium meliloti]QGJ74524.1 hypothetical protein C3L21_11305 [Sinorhizobium meliloti]RVL63449.1 hypothetical protein CN138_31780 [Sinorhizobium meliloti]WQO40234.1 hypothetical protein U8C34_26620 [Sinorhizobium meliloti]
MDRFQVASFDETKAPSGKLVEVIALCVCWEQQALDDRPSRALKMRAVAELDKRLSQEGR